MLAPLHPWPVRATFGAMLELVPSDRAVLAPLIAAERLTRLAATGGRPRAAPDGSGDDAAFGGDIGDGGGAAAAAAAFDPDDERALSEAFAKLGDWASSAGVCVARAQSLVAERRGEPPRER